MAQGTMIDAFFVNFAADTSLYKKGGEEIVAVNKKTQDSTKATQDEIGKRLKTTSDAFGKLKLEALGFFAAIAGGRGLEQLFLGSVNASAAAGRAAEAFGSTSKHVSAWQAISKQIGDTADQGTQALNSLNQAYWDATLTGGSKQSALLTRTMHIRLTDPKTGKERDPSDIMKDVGHYFKGISAQLAVQEGSMLGFTPAMSEYLHDTPDAQIGKDVNTQGSVNEAAAKAAEALQKKWGELQTQIDTLATDMMVRIAPDLVTALTGLTQFVSAVVAAMTGNWGPLKKLLTQPGPDADLPYSAPGAYARPGEMTVGQREVNKQIVDYFTGKGLSKDKSASIAGALFGESNGDPSIVNPTSGASGIAQWLGPRLKAFQAAHGGLRPDQTSLKTQLDFMYGELQGPEKASLDALRASKEGVSSDAGNFALRFERPVPKSGWTGKQVGAYRNRAGVAALRAGGYGDVGDMIHNALHPLPHAPNPMATITANHLRAIAGRHQGGGVHIGQIVVHAPHAKTNADIVRALKDKLFHTGVITQANTGLE